MKKQLILGSKSPRRQQILKDAGYNFTILTSDEEEIVDGQLAKCDVPEALAIDKAKHILPSIKEDDFILLTADTIVLLHDEIIGKPKDTEEARAHLQKLSGEVHEVVSGVCITTKNTQISFSDITKVGFKHLTEEEIEYYVNNYEVLDKAGAYAVQEWIGMIGVKYLEGSYFNVMGLPIHKVYKELKTLM
ncbi:MAG: Maf family nucleotide pyrophosphatase [Chitinophagales bacterium]